MKPKKLVISAFGPYGEKTVVDFEKLGEKGLYLITGDTCVGSVYMLFTFFNTSSAESDK